MVVVYGTRLYGRVDEVPGLFHVATQFVHVWFVPLIPFRSHLVVSEDSSGWRGIPVPLSPKSILLTWLRALFLFLVLSTGLRLWGAVEAGGALPEAALTFLFALSAWWLSTWSKLTRRASYERARLLAEYVDLSAAGWARLEAHFGRPEPKARSECFVQSAIPQA